MRNLTRCFLASAALLFANLAQAAPIFYSDFDTLYSADSTDGIASLVGSYSIFHSSFDIALDSAGTIYSISSGGVLYQVDATNANTVLIGNAGVFINGLAFDNFGTLYGSGGSNLYTLDLLTGAATFVGNTGFVSAGDIVFDASNNLFLSSSSHELISVNPVTGAGLSIGAFGVNNMYGLVSVGNNLYGGSSSGGYYSIDSTTGAASLINNSTLGFIAGMASAPAEVPAPAPLALLAFGLATIFLRRKTN